MERTGGTTWRLQSVLIILVPYAVFMLSSSIAVAVYRRLLRGSASVGEVAMECASEVPTIVCIAMVLTLLVPQI